MGRPDPMDTPTQKRMLAIRSTIKRRTYRDSVRLMQMYTSAKSLPGVTEAACLMGTERNKELLAANGLMVPEAASATPDDLIVVVQGEVDTAVDRALASVNEMLAAAPAAVGATRDQAPRPLDSALRRAPEVNLALISVPGPYAAAEATRALRRGLHVHLFSDNVSLEDEIALKRLGRERGLLVMGPDCGTAIIGGVPLGFANAVARGPIGIVGASGTGIQQVSVLIDRLGAGISHAIGTGGRDLSDAVGGAMTLMALETLEDDPETAVILIVSKPPGPATLQHVLRRARACSKPVVVCFLGEVSSASGGPVVAETLEEAAVRAVTLAGGQSGSDEARAFPREGLCALVAAEVAPKLPEQRSLRGLYTGGTLADEAMHVLGRFINPIRTNVPLSGGRHVAGSESSAGHVVLDLGDDEFTRGRPHPMIEPSLRAERLTEEAADPNVAVILCDVVIGYGSHPDPAAVLAAAVRSARARAGRHLTVVASVCGTESDPQGLEHSEQVLRQEGVLVFPSNAYAAEVAGAITRGCLERTGR